MNMLGSITVALLALPCQLSAQDGCAPLLQVDFTYTLDGYTILLTDQSTNQLTDVHYYWIYGDGIVDHLGTGTHTYADTGSYQVCLSVSGSNGTDTCSGLYCETVLIAGAYNSTDAFTMGPIPFYEAVYIYGAPSDATVTLFDMNGSMVWLGAPTADASGMRLDLIHLAPGFYAGVFISAAGERRFRLVKAYW